MSENLMDHYRREVKPKLSVDMVFTHASHNFIPAPGKVRGGCPHHKSKSGTAFYVATDSMLWYCPTCKVGGDEITYLHWLRGGHGNPGRKDFIVILKELYALAGVDFPTKDFSEQEIADFEKWQDRVGQMELMISLSEERLWSAEGKPCLDYLRKRGLSDEFIKEKVHLGLSWVQI